MSADNLEKKPLNLNVIMFTSEADLAVIRATFDREFMTTVHQGLEQITPAQVARKKTLGQRLSGVFRLGR